MTTQEVDHMIHAGWIVVDDPTQGFETRKQQTLVMKNGLITDILPTDEAERSYTAASVLRLPTHILLPGFINAHTHVPMSYFRGIADDLPLMTWLTNHIWPAEKKMVSYPFVKDATLLACAEMLRSGTTCFNDSYFFPTAVVEAAQIAGLRAHIGVILLEFETPWAKNAAEYLDKGNELLDSIGPQTFIKATMAPHAPYTVSDDSFLAVQRWAEKHDLKIHLHLHETEGEVQQSLKEYGKRPIQRLHDLGLMSDRLIAVHMTAIDDSDFAILEKTKPALVHCPESNMKLASGICPVQKCHSLELNVALGTDGVASNNDLNMFGEIRSAAMLAKVMSRNPEHLPAMAALKMATIKGAEALGIAEVTGSLAPGKSADIQAIDLNHLETLPIYDPVSQVIYAASRHQITDVWVGGKQLLKNRTLTQLDENELKEKAQFWHEKISMT